MDGLLGGSNGFKAWIFDVLLSCLRITADPRAISQPWRLQAVDQLVAVRLLQFSYWRWIVCSANQRYVTPIDQDQSAW